MKIKTTLEAYPKTDSVVTIGTFDGVHIGHQKIIKRLVTIAKKEKLQAVVLTFFPHPRMVLQKDANIKLINIIDEKSQLLENLGIDHLVIKKFTRDFSRLGALEFVRDVLVNKLHVKHIIIGYDHRFGRNRNANVDNLREYGEVYGFKVTEISAQEIDEVAVSSTKIRKALSQGDIETANAYLGYNFMLTGKVVKGKNLGEKIGFPTANIHIEEPYKLIPKTGSYVVKSKIDDVTVYGMMNIGNNPTVSGEKQSIEVHFFNFKKNIYNQKIKVELLKRLRDEQKFNSIDDLKAQLSKDKLTSLNFLEQNNV
ncbi:bifunctional riboflavin kinase/FAD synthetase [Pontimicrobium aquaticum]|uniref:Riboflavin biosynthesis protein n=1 Tax=Pontimicrobium aquaticum TaxID=2565367 RepID=A0A4U0F056_9FLAO|nr:bifunctional riboflavin kinase/FAD synthetase [Pontimicrobium aquaticum]TJY37747.1 bifunctional riboflavin kinase/FAD synthetase [Pontimicrobium aquaticum]